jgi:peptidoglycan biosynthesis protein MviN/MurJ (putative lipid II flippase)
MPFKESGIALATTISSILNLVALLYILNNKIKGLSISISTSLLRLFLKELILPIICSLLMGVACYIGLNYIPVCKTLLTETIRTGALVVIGVSSYLVFSYLFQRNVLKEIIYSHRSG